MENVKTFFELHPNAKVVYVVGNDYYINPVAGSTPVTREDVTKEKTESKPTKKNKD